MQKKLMLSLLIITFLIAFSANNAFAAPDKTVQRTYEFVAGDPVPAIPQQYIKDGVVYRLQTPMGLPTVASTFVLTRDFSTTERKDDLKVSVVENGQYQDIFDTVIPVDEGNYTGAMTRQSFELIPYYVSRERVIQHVETYRALPSNDVSQIPQWKTYTITSDVGDNTTQQKDLKVAAIHWEVEAYDSSGIPTSWIAEATYRGLESYRTKEDYTVVTTYRGIATHPGENMQIAATYESTETTTTPDTPFDPDAPESDHLFVADEELNETNWLARVLAAIVSGSLVTVVGALLFPNAAIIDHDENTIKRLRLKKQGKDSFYYRMPTPLFERLYPSNTYYLTPKNRLLKEGRDVTITTLLPDADTTVLYQGEMTKRNQLAINVEDREEGN